MCIACRHELVTSSVLRLAMGADGAADAFGEPDVEAHYAPSRAVRIEHLDLKLSLEPVASTFSGEATLRLRRLPIFRGVAALDLDEVQVDAVLSSAGAPLRWTHTDGELRVLDLPDDGVVVVRWHGADPLRGLYFTGPTAAEPERQHMAWTQCQDEDGHFVFPCHDHPGVKHTWSVRLDAPEGYTLLSNGAAVEEGVADGRAWARFEQAEPMPAYLFTAVAARLSVIHAKGASVPVRYLVPVGQEEATARGMGKTPLMIDAFAKRTGVAFPWPRYDQVVVHDFVFGGMENIGCTTMTDLLLVDERAALEWDPDGLVAHELAHQWFGDLVTCQDWSQAWLNESWATFMETVWWDEDRDADEATWYRWELATAYFSEDGGRYRRPIVSYNFREPIDVFDRHLYQKGACVLSTLRFELGEDAFWAGVKTYLQDHRFKTVHTRHFQRALEETTGANLDRFFDSWVFGAGHPALDVALAEEAGLLQVTVKQTQEGTQTAPVFHLTLRLDVVYEDGTNQVIDLPVRARERVFALPITGPVRTVRVDPGFRVLAAIKLSGPTAWLAAATLDVCPVLAVRAAKALLDAGTPAGLAAVERALGEHPFYGVRATIARALGGRGGADARDMLLDRLDDEGDPRALRGAVDGLGAFREAEVADALIDGLDGEIATLQLHGSLLFALGRTRDPRAAQAIRAHLDTRSWADVVASRALAGLAATEDASVLDTLLAYTEVGHTPRVRAAAAAALGTFGDQAEPVRKRAGERLAQLVHGTSFRTRIAAVDALGSLGYAPTASTLEQVHRADPDGRIRRSAFESLRRLRKGRTSQDGLTSLRTRLDSLAEENHKLRARLDKLERTE